MPAPIAAEYYIGVIDGELVCHIATSPAFHINSYRAMRFVVMPEWQGVGIGTKFLNWIAEYIKNGNGRKNKKLPVMFHTSHPQLINFLKNSNKWVLKSQKMYGDQKAKNKQAINASRKQRGYIGLQGESSGYGGHFRAIQGFKYIGGK